MGIFTPHARERALERYGLDLHIGDMRQILAACVDGKALLGRSGEHGHVYLMKYKDQTIIPVLDYDRTLIVSFMPSDYFISGANRRYHKRIGNCKQRASHAKFAGREGYQRQRITVRDALDEI